MTDKKFDWASFTLGTGELTPLSPDIATDPAHGPIRGAARLAVESLTNSELSWLNLSINGGGFGPPHVLCGFEKIADFYVSSVTRPLLERLLVDEANKRFS